MSLPQGTNTDAIYVYLTASAGASIILLSAGAGGATVFFAASCQYESKVRTFGAGAFSSPSVDFRLLLLSSLTRGDIGTVEEDRAANMVEVRTLLRDASRLTEI